MDISSNKIIVKNTILLYIRMVITMSVSLYTSRVVLAKLGLEDYGIYQVVGGIVGMLSFLNGALSTGSARFLTYALGQNDQEKLSKTFSTTLSIHIVLAIIVVILAETIGLWFFYHELEIPKERLFAASVAYHLSILTSLIAITQVPYSAVIVAHERFNIYAYMSIVDVILKLAVAYLLTISRWDRLIFYSFMLCCIQVGLAFFYRFYCIKNFDESRYKFVYDKCILKDIAAFSGWSLFSNLSIALNAQGTTIITNMFFSPAVVAARAIALQINMAAMQLIGNFRTAVDPQIVKRYASGDGTGSRELLLESTKYSFFLMYIIAFPIILLAEPLLQIWLGQVPEYSVIFLQLVVIESLFSIFDSSLYTALYAKGRLKENALISPFIGLIRFVVVYFLFKNGFSPVALSWAGIVSYAILGLLIKPVLVHKLVNYSLKELRRLYVSCFWVVLVSVPLVVCFCEIISLFSYNQILCHFLKALCCVIVILVTVYYLGLEHSTRVKVCCYLKTKFKFY